MFRAPETPDGLVVVCCCKCAQGTTKLTVVRAVMTLSAEEANRIVADYHDHDGINEVIENALG